MFVESTSSSMLAEGTEVLVSFYVHVYGTDGRNALDGEKGALKMGGYTHACPRRVTGMVAVSRHGPR
jgi:hypothetical protein